MADEVEKSESRGLPIAIGPVKLDLQIQNIDGLRAAWDKYCVPISRTFWPLIKGEIDIALQKQLLRKIQNVTEIEKIARQIIAARGAIREEVSPSIADPLIEAAADEERAELKELWAQLLAAAMDPKRKQFVRADIITTLKQFEPLDARVLQAASELKGTQLPPNARDNIAQKLSATSDEIEVSMTNLARLGCLVPVDDWGAGPYVTVAPRGRMLIQALR